MKKFLGILLTLVFLCAPYSFAADKYVVLKLGGPDWSSIEITGGTIDGTPIGATTPAAGTFTTLTANTAIATDGAGDADIGTEALYFRKGYFGTGFSLEGATDNAFQLNLALVDPTTPDKTITFPDLTGTVGLSTNNLDFFADGAAASSIGALTVTVGDILYATGADAYTQLDHGAQGALLMANAAAAPSWLTSGASGYYLIGAGTSTTPVWTQRPAGLFTTLGANDAVTLGDATDDEITIKGQLTAGVGIGEQVYASGTTVHYLVSTLSATSGTLNNLRVRAQSSAESASTSLIRSLYGQAVTEDSYYGGSLIGVHGNFIAKSGSTTVTGYGGFFEAETDSGVTAITNQYGVYIRTKAHIDPTSDYYGLMIDNEKMATGYKTDAYIGLKSTSWSSSSAAYGIDMNAIYDLDTADLRGHHGEIIYNDPDGTWDFGAANITTTGDIAGAATALTISTKVNEGAGISKGQCVYISGATGQFPQVSLCDNTSGTKHDWIGLSAEDKTDNQTMLVRVGGELTAVDTDGTGAPGAAESWADGDPLYMSTAGLLTDTIPTSGQVHIVAYVSYTHGTNGKLLVANHEETYIAAASGDDVVIRMGDSSGSNKTLFKDYANNEVAYIDSDGNIDGTALTLDTALAVAEGGTGATTLTDHGVVLGSATGAVTVTDSGAEGEVLVSGGASADPDWGYIDRGNLLTNTEWLAASNSTFLEAIGGAAPVLDGANAALTNNLALNGAFDSVTTSWTAGDSAVLSSDGGGKTGNTLTITEGTSGAANPYAYQTITTVAGKLYQFTYYINDGTEATYVVDVGSSGAESTEYYTATGEAVDDWTTTTATVVFEAAGVSTTVTLTQTAAAGDTTLFFDSITLYEVTPGFVGSDSLCFDGWAKDSTLDIFREHNGSNTKDGSFYAIKSVPSVQSDFILWPAGRYDKQYFYQRFQGRTVTLGAWVKSSTASDIRMEINDGSSTYSGYHTGGGVYEWLEVTATISGSSTDVEFGYRHGNVAPSVAYISQVRLVFGSSIGSGNYQAPKGEIIWFDNPGVTSTLFNAKVDANGFSDVGLTLLNLEADSKGVIGKGVAAIYMKGTLRDSASVTTSHLRLGFSSNGSTPGPAMSIAGIGNNLYAHRDVEIATDANGDIYYQVEASGGSTFDISEFYFIGIQTR